MADQRRFTEKTEVRTETKRSTPAPEREESEYRKETTVRTERVVEKDPEVIVVENE
jgi:hypothetical protein